MTRPGSRRLVIVEDEGVLALDLQRHLTTAGFDVRGVAADSESALELVDRERPDLVLMDINIQGTTDGVDTAAVLRERFDVAVVYLTAHGDPGTIERAQRTQPMGYLLKPFRKPDLQNVVTIAMARSHQERQLRRREEMLSTTLSCIGEAIFTTDGDGRVTWMNPAAEHLLGKSSADLVARPLSAAVPLQQENGEPLPRDLVEDTRARGRVRIEGTLANGDGHRSVVGTAAPLKHGASSFGVVVALRDLTELLVARQQLEFAERLSSIGQLAAGVAHEVNNPLSVVIANVGFTLEDEPNLAAETREALVDARDAAHRIRHIVSGLGGLSQPQTETVRAFDPREALASGLAFTRSHWRTLASMVLDLRPVPTVMGSPIRLTQVVVNLIINAVHAMQTVGERCHQLTLSSGTDAQGRAVLSVRDTGPGIPEKLRERIFEPFFTTKPIGKGTGLGLGVSRNIIDSHGGRLELASSDEGGTCFTITLPGCPRVEVVRRPKVVWVGAELPLGVEPQESLLLDPNALGPAQRLLDFEPDVVVLAAQPPESVLSGWMPDWRSKCLVLGQAPQLGVVTLLEPFDAHALAAFVRPRRD